MRSFGAASRDSYSVSEEPARMRAAGKIPRLQGEIELLTVLGREVGHGGFVRRNVDWEWRGETAVVVEDGSVALFGVFGGNRFGLRQDFLGQDRDGIRRTGFVW